MSIIFERGRALAEFTSFKVGGSADYFCRVRSIDELKEALAFARSRQLPIFILGGGTNVLLPDEGFRGVVIKIEIKGITFSAPTPPPLREVSASGGRRMLVGAGEPWDSFVAETVARGWWGLENLSGIPGTVGGAPVQNIGAYGSDVKDTIEWVEVLDTRTEEIKQLAHAECAFAYRDSIFKKPEGKHVVITRVAFRLRTDGAPNLAYKDLAEYFAGKPTPPLAEIRRAVLDIRSRKFPDLKTHGTAGSFFKNPIIAKEKFEELKKKYPELPGFPVGNDTRCLPPINIGCRETISAPNVDGLQTFGAESEKVKISLAWILDKICNLKGFEQDNAALWKDQPLVLVNKGGASASAVSALADEVARAVKEKTGIEIEREVNVLC